MTPQSHAEGRPDIGSVATHREELTKLLHSTRSCPPPLNLIGAKGNRHQNPHVAAARPGLQHGSGGGAGQRQRAHPPGQDLGLDPPEQHGHEMAIAASAMQASG